MRNGTSEGTPAAFILAATLAAGILGGIASAAPKEAPDPAAWKDGAEVYTKICALCHDTAIGPVIRGRNLDPLYVSLIVRNGSRAMPAFRSSEIDDETLKKLAQYLSQSGGEK